MNARRFLHCILVTVILQCCSIVSLAQDKIHAQLFEDADRMMAQAREKKADIYAPTNFAKAIEYYNDADEAFRKGKNLEDIRGKLRGTTSYLLKAMDACKLAEVTFSSVMGARTDAISASAPKSSGELWRKAEAQFKTAAQALEDGDVNEARKEAGGAEAIYRTAELEAIKANYLTPARQLLQRADAMDAKDNAPRTLDKAKTLAAKAEALLKQNRYDTDEARQLAQNAKYEAAHAIYLHQTIISLKKSDRGFEDVMLTAEEPLQRIAGALDVKAEFDAGFDGPSKDVVAAITTMKSNSKRDAETIRDQQSEIQNLRQQVASMEGRLGTLSANEKQLQNTLTTQKQQEETIAQTARLFTEEEGIVVRDGNNIILRLWGMVFPFGRNTIEPQFFGLLTKVQEAIRKYPGCQVAIEGHTDSQGTDESNQRLSESRAEAVAEYLKANMGVGGAQITWAGYGENRPIASNDNNEGRTKNRRIDVVIIPEWAIIGK